MYSLTGKVSNLNYKLRQNYSTHLDYTINMTTVVCLVLYLAVLQYKFGNRPHINFIFPAVLAVATPYSWAAGMTFFIFVLAATFWHPDEKIRDRIRQLISFCAVYGILIIVVIPLMVAVWVSPSAGGTVYVYGIDSLPVNRRLEFLRLVGGQQFKVAWSFPQLVIFEVVPEKAPTGERSLYQDEKN